MSRITVLRGAIFLLAMGALAQEPIHPPPRQTGERAAGELRSEPPPLPVEEIIRRFAARESEFKEARERYIYTQSVRVQEYDSNGDPVGEYRFTSDILYTPEGRRFEQITYAPPSTLKRTSITREDTQDLENIQPFVLTTDALPEYNLEYRGRQRVDELDTYVFRVTPKRIEKGRRYFEGQIWVDDRDLQIVKTDGRAVPDIRHGLEENLFPRFETYRENIDGQYWFPTYTHADDVLRFKEGDIRIRMTVRYSNYKQFRVNTRILGATPVNPDDAKPPQPPQKP